MITTPGVHTLSLSRIKQILFALIPSFLQNLLYPSLSRPKRLFATSYLDGLRGLAAFLVVSYHAAAMYMQDLMPLYGLPKTQEGAPASSSILQLPFLRLLISGRPMVHIFFIISGWALSLKPLKQIRSKQHTALLGTLSSSIFRRSIRLFLPVVCSTAISGTLVQFRIRVDPRPELSQQFKLWYQDIYLLVDFWNTNDRHWIKLEPHLWTIPLEMGNSMVLFVVLIGLARCTVPLRMSLLAGIILWTMSFGQWVASEFLMGTFLAELGLIQDQVRQDLSVEDDSTPSRLHLSEEEGLLLEKHDHVKERQEGLVGRTRLRKLQRIGGPTLHILCPLGVLIAVYICGWPEKYTDQSESFSWLTAHTYYPHHNNFNAIQYPWFALSALLIVFACQQMRYMQRFLELSVFQYLGKISYSMYLLHWTVLQSTAPRVMGHIQKWVERYSGSGTVGPWGVTLVWFLTILAVTPVLVWASDLFSRLVDQRCIKLAKWVEEKCCIFD